MTPSSSDTEKENAPCGTNGTDVKTLLITLENDLRQEEATLLLLQKLRESQNANNSSSSRSASKGTLNSSQSSSSLNNNVSASNQKPASSQSSSQRPPSATQSTKSTILFCEHSFFSYSSGSTPAEFPHFCAKSYKTGSLAVTRAALCH